MHHDNHTDTGFTVVPRKSRSGRELGGFTLRVDRNAAQVDLPGLIPSLYDTAEEAHQAGHYYVSGGWARDQATAKAKRHAAVQEYFAKHGQAPGMATEKQVRLLLDLIADRETASIPAHPLVPTTIEGLAGRTSAQASTHINDMTRSY